MGVFADELRKMVIHATSPDSHIGARVTPPCRVEVRFARGAYARYDGPTLGSQLGRLATSLWVEYQRGCREALGRALGEPVRDGRLDDRRRREYQAELGRLVAEGESPDGRVRMECEGLSRWRVEVEPAVPREVGEEEFLRLVDAAGSAALWEYLQAVRDLKNEFFDLRLPDRAGDRG
jgi:hypothetical protein